MMSWRSLSTAFAVVAFVWFSGTAHAMSAAKEDGTALAMTADGRAAISADGRACQHATNNHTVNIKQKAISAALLARNALDLTSEDELRQWAEKLCESAKGGCAMTELSALCFCGRGQSCYPKHDALIDGNVGVCGASIPVLVCLALAVFVGLLGMVALGRMLVQEKNVPMSSASTRIVRVTATGKPLFSGKPRPSTANVDPDTVSRQLSIVKEDDHKLEFSFFPDDEKQATCNPQPETPPEPQEEKDDGERASQ